MTAAELNACFIVATTTLTSFQPGHHIAHGDGVTLAFSHLPLASNYGIISEPAGSEDEFAARVATAVDYGRRSGVPWRFVVCGDWLAEGFEPHLVANGLTRVAELHAMWTDRLRPPSRPLPAMTFSRATDAGTLASMVAINNAHYRLEPATGTSLYLGYVRVPHACAITGMVDDEPVSCAGALPAGHALYVGAVATRAAWRGRGYGEGVLRRALDESIAASGVGRAVLFALPQRIPFYRALGFTAATRLRVYLPDAS